MQTQEDFAKIQEERRLASIRSFRLAALDPYDGFVEPETLNAIETCSIQVFEYILATAKADKEAWEEEERREEQARKTAEKLIADAKAKAQEIARKEEEDRKAEAAPDREKMAIWILQLYEVAYNAPLVKTEIGVQVRAHIEEKIQEVVEEVREYLYSKM